MRFLIWLLRAALFLFLLGLAIKNDGAVTVHFFFDGQWRVPLVVVMLVMFVVGALLGSTATLSTLFAQQREIRRLARNSQSGRTTPSSIRTASDSSEVD